MVSGILLLYYQPLKTAAPTIAEHVSAIPTRSRYRTWVVNTALGFPPGLVHLRFRVIVLHYSLFGPAPVFGSWPDGLSEAFVAYIRSSADSYKIAFFQDEHHFCRARFRFINDCAIDTVYTLLDPEYWDAVYRTFTPSATLKFTLTGYIDSAFVSKAEALSRPDDGRTVDIGYRARRLPYYMGTGGQEKTVIADEFVARAAGSGLTLDVAVGEGSRIYGDAWWRFLADCRGVLGVEAGVSIFDLDDAARTACDRLLAAEPSITFREAHDRLLYQWDGNIEYRTISPRHFEAAALRVCQILFEGKYNGILRPWVHYIPLKKDFSNFDEVLRAFRDPTIRRTITDAAYRDLIASGDWSYDRFVAEFDRDLADRGIHESISAADAEAVTAALERGRLILQLRGRIGAIRHARFPGRESLATAIRRLVTRT